MFPRQTVVEDRRDHLVIQTNRPLRFPDMSDLDGSTWSPGKEERGGGSRREGRGGQTQTQIDLREEFHGKEETRGEKYARHCRHFKLPGGQAVGLLIELT